MRNHDQYPAAFARARERVAVATAHAAATLSRRAGYSGTALPGLIAEFVAPHLVTRMADDLGAVVIVSGTNGKTTTAHLLVHILEHARRPVVANRSGANLRQALASSLVEAVALDGRLRIRGATGIFEIDEAALGAVADSVPISVLVLLNLFRDQLDRFGETDEIVRRWQRLLDRLPADVVVVFCADDPRLAHLVTMRPGPSIPFGLSAPPIPASASSLTPDVTTCPRCAGRLAYRWTSVGPIGDFTCRRCDFARPEPVMGVRVVTSRGIAGQTLAFRCPMAARELTVTIRLPGLSNAYNALAAVAAASVLDIGAATAVDALADARAAFGRYEELEIDGRRVVLTLGKNPASLAVLAGIALESEVSAILFALNDDFADGQDVSWYWDVDVSPILRGRSYAVCGVAAHDFLLRLKYGGERGAERAPSGLVQTSQDPVAALDRLVATSSPGGTILVVATYTALLALRRSLVARAYLPAPPT